MSFDRLGLSPELLAAVADEGYTVPTPVQEQAIPPALAGRDVLAGAQTGTGKTAAFVLPILQRLNGTRAAPAGGTSSAAPAAMGRDGRGRPRPAVRALVLAPTRELALQVEQSVRVYGARRQVRSTPIYGGVGFEPQARALRAGAEVVVATPGRLLDHVNQRTIDLSAVEVLVLDEADRMLDMGFIRDIRTIIGLLPAVRQNLLFSATFSDEIRRLADGILRDPVTVQVTPRNATAELVRQVVVPVDRERKRELLSALVRGGRIDQALVFTRTKHGANRLAEQLLRDGISAAAIHGNRSQSQRVRALADFKARRVAILVATDIAARGIDIDSLPHVVNFELPMVAADYIHRIGRTGRAGVDGDAISLVCVDEAPLLREIERLLRRSLPVEVVAGFEPDRSIRPEPIRLRSAPMGRPTSTRPTPGRGGSGARPQGGGHPIGGRPGRRDASRGPGPRPVDRSPSNGRERPPQERRDPGARIGNEPPRNWGRSPAALPGERLSRLGHDRPREAVRS